MDSDGLAGLRYDEAVCSIMFEAQERAVRSAYVLFLGLFSVYIGQSILGPVLPPLVRELGLSEFQGGLIMTFSSVMWVIFSPMWGRRSEVWGRKPVFILALAGYALGVGTFGVVMQLSLSGVFASMTLAWLLLVAARMIVGILFSGAPPAAQAYVADTTSGQERTTAMGLISAATGLGTVFGPALGAIVVSLGLVAPIFLSAVLPLVGLVAVAILLPRTQPRVLRGHKPPRMSALDPRIWPILAIGVSIMTISSLIQFTIAFYFQDRLQLGGPETAQAVGAALMASGVAVLFAQMVLIRVFKWSPFTLLRLGLPLLLLAVVLLIFSTNFILLAASLVIEGLGIGLAIPGFRSAITFAVEADEQGAAAGLASSISGIGFVIGPGLGTGLYGVYMLLPYLFAVAVLIAGLMVLFIHPRTRVRGAPQAA
jgi:MFS transporter, DHA1 family, tetracycline resistance protein